MSRRISMIVNGLFLLAMAIGCTWQLLPKKGSSPMEPVRESQPTPPSTAVILYSLHPNGESKVSKELLHSWPVLAKLEIREAKLQQQVRDELQASIDAKGELFRCFTPRHAIRITTEGRTTDYVICFECGSVRIYEGAGEDYKAIQIGPQAMTLFNKILKEASIPLAQDQETEQRKLPDPKP